VHRIFSDGRKYEGVRITNYKSVRDLNTGCSKHNITVGQTDMIPAALVGALSLFSQISAGLWSRSRSLKEFLAESESVKIY
jgi:AAA15 family ATPase/GTPase